MIKGPVDLGEHGVGPEGAMIIDRFVNAFVFSMAAGYSTQDHKKWFQRSGCGYHVGVVLDGKRFVELLAHRIHRRRRGGPIAAAKPIYRTGVVDLSKEQPKMVDIFRYKHPSLSWENEYRLIYADPKLGDESRQALFPQSMKLANCIIDVIEFEETS